MKGLIGRKLGMTSLYQADGRSVAVTVLQVGPCVVAQQRTTDRDGYEALQLAFEPVLDEQASAELAPEQRERRIAKRVPKPQLGHYRSNGLEPHRVLREVRVEDAGEVPVGSVLTVDMFEVGELVDVVGTTRGRGFAGAMRRHGFSGQGASHGAKIHRKPASAGATDAARVFKGKRSPGHLGNVRVTTANLVVQMVDTEKHLLALRGSVPGATGGLVMVFGEE